MALFLLGAVLMALAGPWWLKGGMWCFFALWQVKPHKGVIRKRDVFGLAGAILLLGLYGIRLEGSGLSDLQGALERLPKGPLTGIVVSVKANSFTFWVPEVQDFTKDDMGAKKWLKLQVSCYQAQLQSKGAWEGRWAVLEHWKPQAFDQINRGAYNPIAYALSRGYDGVIQTKAKAVIPSDGRERKGIAGQLNQVNAPLDLRLKIFLKGVVETRMQGLEPRGKRWLDALLFGNLDDQQNDQVQALGILHLCVVSGYHYALILSLVHRAISVRWGIKSLEIFTDWAGAVVTHLVAASGFGSDRACMSAQAGLVAFLLRRRLQGHRGLMLMATALLLLAPSSIEQVGFQITFVATGALLLGRSVGARWRHVQLPLLVQTLLEGAFVTLFIMPLLLVHFNEQPLLQVLATALFTPLVSLVMVMGIAYLGLGFGIFGLVLGRAIEVFCKAFDALLSSLGRSGGPLFSIDYALAFAWAAIALLILGYWCWPRGSASWRQAMGTSPFGLAMIVAGILLLCRVDFGLSVRTYALKDGESYLIRAPGAVIVYDVGNDPALVYHLKRAGVRRIDLLVISHPHQDHDGLFTEVQSNFEVVSVIRSLDPNAHGKWSALGKLNFVLGQPGADSGGTFVHADNPNENSIAMMGYYQKRNQNQNQNQYFLLTGDLEEQGLRWLLKSFWQGEAIHLLKAAHHGSYVADYPEILKTLDPEFMWFSGGRGKRVNKRPLKAELLRQQIKFYDTMEHGELYWGTGPESLQEVIKGVIQDISRRYTK